MEQANETIAVKLFASWSKRVAMWRLSLQPAEHPLNDVAL